MMYEYLPLLYLILLPFLFGLHDGSSHESNRRLSDKERRRWHFWGTTTWVVASAVMVVLMPWYKVLFMAIFGRACAFDKGYNIAAGIRLDYIGDGGEFSEILFLNLFGANNGYAKSIFFLVLYVLTWFIFNG